MVFFSRWLRRLRVFARLTQHNREMSDEMRFHVEMEALELQRTRGLSGREARRQASLAFGGAERHQEAAREARGIALLSSMSLDFKLGLRMLAKHPALAIVGGLGMAVVIAIAAGFFTYTTAFWYSSPPVDEGKRIVAVENRNLLDSEDWSATLFDYQTWRRELTSVPELAAFRRVLRNVHAPGGAVERAHVAEMTASGFQVARVAPLLGRPLLDADEQAGARAVIVIGHREWHELFAADPDVVGRQLRLGSVMYDVVGVMPQGFRFPLNFGFWTALATNPSAYGAGEGPAVRVFGRLAPGVSPEVAQVQLSAIGARMSSDHADVYEHLRPTIVRYVHSLLDVQQYPAWFVWVMQLFAALLLTVVAVNVAVLVYARTAARRPEITVRAALGASRSRIVGQLFLEALVLALLAAAVGLLIAQLGYQQLATIISLETVLPYWIGASLSPAVIPYAILLAILAAFVVGVLPALQATGRDLQTSLRTLGSVSEPRMGRTWTTLIVVQVAIAVAALPAVVAIASKSIWRDLPEATFPVDQLLSLRLSGRSDVPPAQQAAWDAARATQQTELIRRLRAEPRVAAVSYARELTPVNIQTGEIAGGSMQRMARVRAIDPAFFSVLGVAVLAGRTFLPAEVAANTNSVIVSRNFASMIFGTGDVVGRSFRARGVDAQLDSTYQIIGVVEDLYVNPNRPGRSEAVVYRSSSTGTEAITIAVRARGVAPAVLSVPVRELASQVAPDWQLNVEPMSQLSGALDSQTIRFLLVIVGIMTLSVLLLSAAGISALMSFAVTRRQREIGIRAALGATRGGIVRAIFARSALQLALGFGFGVLAATGLDAASGGELLGGKALVLVPFVMLLMIAAALLATVGPARRAWRVHPMAALRQD